MRLRQIFLAGGIVVLGGGLYLGGISLAADSPKPDETAEEILYKDPAKVSLKELFDMADCVVMGEVKSVKAKREIELLPVEMVKERLREEEKVTGEKRMHLLEERRRIEMVNTYVKLSPEEWFKNEGKEKEIIIQVGGGMSENLTVFVDYIGGTPRFKEKQRVLVFLEKTKEQPYYRMILGAKGEYVIKKDKIYNLFFGKEMPLKGFLEEIKGFKNEMKDKEVKKE